MTEINGFDSRKIYDAIIVGAGPSGCVLAHRLSEHAGKQVLLIEAGPDDVAPGAEHPDLLNPFAPIASNNSRFHWPNILAETGADPGNGTPRSKHPYLQGYGVGGASNINGMGVDRGQPDDYTEWCELGACGWDWDDVLPYFRKLERDLDFSGPPVSPMHGDRGPMPVRRLPRSQWAPFVASIADALQRRGFDYIEDYNADFRDGFSSAPTNGLPDRRVSAAMAYLSGDVRCRPNLTILKNTKVDQLLASGVRINGVSMTIGNTAYSVSSRHTIVCGGAIQSPALLMRSGIGAADQLANLGIPVVRDLPGVGANLQNHPYVMLGTYLPRASVQSRDNAAFLQNWLRFSSGCSACHPKDMHLMAFNKCDWHALGRRVGAVAVSVLKAYSKGRVELASSDPTQAPRVFFNLLADSRDFERLVSGLRLALEVFVDPMVAKTCQEVFSPDGHLVASLSKRNAWNRLKAKTIVSLLDRAPLRRRLLNKSLIVPSEWLADEEKLREFVRASAQPQFHVCGTCRMGRIDDPSAVVDAAGRVHGVEGLRVVDASIFPTIPRAYTHFVVLMASEKIADAIKKDWRD